MPSRGTDLHHLPIGFRYFQFPFGVGDTEVAQGAQLWHGDVLSDTHGKDHSLPLPVFRNESDSMGHGIVRALRRIRLAPDRHRSTITLVDTEDRPHDLGTPGTDKSEETEDLTLVEAEGDILECPQLAEVLDRENLVADIRILLGKHMVDIAPDHHVDDLIGRRIGDLPFTDILSVTQDGIVIAYLENLFELM